MPKVHYFHIFLPGKTLRTQYKVSRLTDSCFRSVHQNVLRGMGLKFHRQFQLYQVDLVQIDTAFLPLQVESAYDRLPQFFVDPEMAVVIHRIDGSAEIDWF